MSLRIKEIRLPLEHPSSALHEVIAIKLKISISDIQIVSLFRRGYDARKRGKIVLVYTVDVSLTAKHDEALILQDLMHDKNISISPNMSYRFLPHAPTNFATTNNQNTLRPVVIGFGPCGMFAALILAQMGFCPLVLERGKSVRERTKDTWGLWREHKLNPESNVQFGEGGAGTFSDGKLYSQIKDPKFYGRKVLEEFVKFGAPEEILYVSKPHIGTFRLVSMVEKIRAEIITLGGEVRFEQRVDDFEINTDNNDKRKITALHLANGEKVLANSVILALGHSARDTFVALHKSGVFMEAKPLSIGLRIEHPQTLIDKSRFGKQAGHPLLGSADYKLTHQASNSRGVYSFCMCPGGQVVAATSEIGCVVTNGMSQYSRSEHNANSALVVEVHPEDFPEDYRLNPLTGIDFQRHWEQVAFHEGGGNYNAPAQTVGDFLSGASEKLDKNNKPTLMNVLPSYQPGIHFAKLDKCLPEFATLALREALNSFDKKIKGFANPDALLTGIETRTSSPIRIKRFSAKENNNNQKKLDEVNILGQSINTQGVYPAGEGAGYAGGIYSAAIDGIKAAEAVVVNFLINSKI